MKVQLYVPPGGYFAERWSKGSSMPPLGLLYIGAVLEKEGIAVEIVPADVLGLDWRDIDGQDPSRQARTSSASRSRPRTASRASSSSGWPRRPIPAR